MGGSDPWSNSDTLSDNVVDAMAERLEMRAGDPRFRNLMAEYLGAMELENAGHVLDLGCGTGVAARWIAAQPGFAGEVLGIDLSPRLVAAASRFADAEGLGGKTRFETGDSSALGLPDGGFDAVVAHTLLSHVDDPHSVIGECARLVRAGGQIGIFDGDYASMSFEEDDEAAAKANSDLLIDALVAQPRIMRRLPRFAAGLGLEIVEVFANVIADVGRAAYWQSAVEGWRKLGPASGLASAEAADDWADAQLRYSDTGVFFGASVFYGYVLRRRD